eukprot:336507-Pyramimonas_sp.AAC.1
MPQDTSMADISACTLCGNFWQHHLRWMGWSSFCDLRNSDPDNFGKQVDDAVAKHQISPPVGYDRASVSQTIETGFEVMQEFRAVPSAQMEFLGKKEVAALPSVGVPLHGGPVVALYLFQDDSPNVPGGYRGRRFTRVFGGRAKYTVTPQGQQLRDQSELAFQA